ncbi:hypothetical protein L1987_35695 [Smallanthus sonchifolius]|uniref:Uncharacterized protein n=1 Tax=Smallanthus sonchifolius TaxID=185202 RepID=A0ACB9HBZ5_9ASTR|nr:hypothetical protein L1987_35695 [Smallanthus sonchifolius]
MVDKAATFLASIRPELEKRILADNDGMHEYSFLNSSDPYHAYYQHRVSEFRAQNGSADGNEKTDPFRPKRLTDVMRKSVSGMTVSSERMKEILKWYRLGEMIEAAAIAVVSPITGELIPVHEMYKHMRISVNDPKYKEQKERLFGKIRETTLAQDDVISRSIVGLARTRPDIFGTTEEEFSNAVTAEIQSKNGVLGFYWHMATQAMSAQEPEPKRQRLDDSLLFPENQFLAQHPGPVCISVWVPEKGQMLELSVESLSESVSSLKEKIAGEIEEAPPANKLKLSGTAGFFNDNLSLAYYNVGGGDVLSLSW